MLRAFDVSAVTWRRGRSRFAEPESLGVSCRGRMCERCLEKCVSAPDLFEVLRATFDGGVGLVGEHSVDAEPEVRQVLLYRIACRIERQVVEALSCIAAPRDGSVTWRAASRWLQAVGKFTDCRNPP
jgi:hypothetical protein